MRSILILIGVLGLTACSSTKQVQLDKPEYCYTSSEYTLQNKQTVSSQVKVECTDHPGKRILKQQIGVSNACREYWYTVGNSERKGLVCQKPGGTNGTTWEIIPVNY